LLQYRQANDDNRPIVFLVVLIVSLLRRPLTLSYCQLFLDPGESI
jgi:hypothetical protein